MRIGANWVTNAIEVSNKLLKILVGRVSVQRIPTVATVNGQKTWGCMSVPKSVFGSKWELRHQIGADWTYNAMEVGKII